MITRCISGKKTFATEMLAEDVLIELWSKNIYSEGHAPVAVYKCDDCGLYHLTSQGQMNERLSKYLRSNQHKVDQEANRWADKFKKK